MSTEVKKRLRGRPPAGTDGKRVRDYAPLLVRVPPRTREIITAIANLTGRSSSQVMNEMVSVYHIHYLKQFEPRLYFQVEEAITKDDEPTPNQNDEH